MPRGRTAITPEQRILDTFAEMETDAQATVLEKLQEMHRFCIKRDGRQKPELEKKPAKKREPKQPDAPLPSGEQG